MCINCWNEAGRPIVINDAVVKAAALVAAVYETHSTGGAGHIVFDDWNIEDDHIDFCLNEAIPDGVAKLLYTPDDASEQRTALEHFRTLTEHERLTALAIVDKLIRADGTMLV